MITDQKKTAISEPFFGLESYRRRRIWACPPTYFCRSCFRTKRRVVVPPHHHSSPPAAAHRRPCRTRSYCKLPLPPCSAADSRIRQPLCECKRFANSPPRAVRSSASDFAMQCIAFPCRHHSMIQAKPEAMRAAGTSSRVLETKTCCLNL